MTTRMLIDARHQEETRVAVVEKNRIEEFDFESAEHKQLKGNIYLAKVTRVEPSLQAAFVDYGGNRHGFLAFSEIHPDYYQIPKEDRERLLAEEAEHAAEEAALRAEEDEKELGLSDEGGAENSNQPESLNDDADILSSGNDDGGENSSEDNDNSDEGDAAEETAEDNSEEDTPEIADQGEGKNVKRGRGNGRKRRGRGHKNVGKASDEVRKKRMALRRRYKIQDVIHRRQVLLVQVVKEERGNKGAALTSYLSLAGRYCVLMPNTSHGGGISRKISNAGDRKRLKSIIADMALPPSMGCIVRTAGLSRTKTEIKRDFDYLARLWDEIRENTLGASAPTRIHSEGDLIRRAIRDIYNRDISEVLVEGPEGYRAAKDFMKLLMPSHAKRVQSYADPVSLFQRYGVEDQLSAMYQPIVQLKSGGYLVINPTEALVSIDINSGRSTKEHGIEATALSTNLEAAREIARQLRLRDMAGLVVIDFIDMEHHSNARKVEKAMKDALKHDRARIQVGRISSFGLMEMSRQRLRTGVLEASSRECPHCEGTGLVRTAASSGLSALRLFEEEAAKGKGNVITLRASQEAVIYLLNNKRSELAEIEVRYGVSTEALPDGEVEGAKMSVSSSGPRPENGVKFVPVVDDDDDVAEEVSGQEDAHEEGQGRKRRRRRGRRGRKPEGEEIDETSSDQVRETPIDSDTDVEDNENGDGKKKRARRGRRGGRRRNQNDGEGSSSEEAVQSPDGKADTQNATPSESTEPVVGESAEPAEADKPRPVRKRRTRKAVELEAKTEAPSASAAAPDVADANEEKPKRKPRARKPKVTEADEPKVETAEAEAATPAKPVRKRKAPTSKKAKADSGNEDDAKPAEKKAKPRAKKAVTKTAAASNETASSAAASDGQEEAQDGPKRQGWWQRTFG